jgi:hypothetical protein
VAGSCEYDGEPSGSGAAELVCSYLWHDFPNGIQHGKPHRTTHSHTRAHTTTTTNFVLWGIVYPWPYKSGNVILSIMVLFLSGY